MKLELKDGSFIEAPTSFEYFYNELLSRKNQKVQQHDNLLAELKDRQQKGGTISDYFWFQIKQSALPVISGEIADLYDEMEVLFNKHNVYRVIK
jgi:hypothetical protein